MGVGSNIPLFKYKIVRNSIATNMIYTNKTLIINDLLIRIHSEKFFYKIEKIIYLFHL